MIRDLFEDRYDDMLTFCNLLRVGVWITDGEGRNLLVNNESCNTGGLTCTQVVGRTMRELLNEGYVEESISLKTLASGSPETMVQVLGDGNQVLVSSQPVFEDGKISYVIITEKDITETELLKTLLNENGMNSRVRADEIEYMREMNLRAYGEFIAADPITKLVVNNAYRVAKTDASVMLTGESGTGKEVCANLIYKSSKRRGRPFIKLNISSLPEDRIEAELFGYERGAYTGDPQGEKSGCFELANGGTLFLDEVCDIPVRLQTKLLDTIQRHTVTRMRGKEAIPVDVRIICATRSDIKNAIAEGSFREDLYYTITVMPIEVPPLRQRCGDISPLAAEFVKVFNKKYRLRKYLTPAAARALEQYDWPGNVRELRNIMERVTITYGGDEINRFQIEQLLYPHDDFAINMNADENDSSSYMYDQLEEYEKKLIMSALAKSRNASEAGRKLGIDKSTMSRRMRKYGLKCKR